MKRIYFSALFSVDGIKNVLSWQEICARSKVNPRKVKKPSIQKWCFVPGQNSSLECGQDQDCGPGTICTQGTCLEGKSSGRSLLKRSFLIKFDHCQVVGRTATAGPGSPAPSPTAWPWRARCCWPPSLSRPRSAATARSPGRAWWSGSFQFGCQKLSFMLRISDLMTII